jgi:DNA-binding MarR family transcriptional regulator
MFRQKMQKRHYDPQAYQPRSSVGYLIRRANGLMADVVDPAFAGAGFTFTQWIVLIRLREGIPLNPKDLCGELRHDSGALTRVLDQLAERGLIERSRGLADRRTVELRLTDAGREVVAGLTPLVVDKLNLSLADFSDDEHAQFGRLLQKFIRGLEQARLPADSTEGARP